MPSSPGPFSQREKGRKLKGFRFLWHIVPQNPRKSFSPPRFSGRGGGGVNFSTFPLRGGVKIYKTVYPPSTTTIEPVM